MADLNVVTPAAPAAAAPTAPQANPNANGIKPEVVAAPDSKATPGTDQKPPEGGKIDAIKKEADPANPDKPFTITVRGKEYAMSLEDLKVHASKGIGAESKFQEAHKKTQQVEAFYYTLKNDPMKILNDPNIGVDFQKLAQDFLYEKIQREQMTPEQRELAEAREKLKVAEDEKRANEQKAQQEQMQNLVKHFSESYEKDMTTTLETSGLPKTGHTVKRLAYYLNEGLKNGVQLKCADVVDFVRQDYHRDIGELFSAADGDVVAKFLGEQNIDKLMKARMKQIRGTSDAPAVAAVAAADSGGTGERLSKDEWREKMEKKWGK